MTTSNKKKQKHPTLQAVKPIAYILLAFMALLFMLSVAGCKPKQIIVNHTEYVDRVKVDSVKVERYDSVYFYQKGDTVRIEKWKLRTEYREKLRFDTVLVTDTFTTVPEKVTVEKKVQVYGFFWWLGFIVFMGFILAGAYRILIIFFPQLKIFK